MKKEEIFNIEELKKIKKISDLEFDELVKISPVFNMLNNYNGEHKEHAYNFMKNFFNKSVKPILKSIEENVDNETVEKIVKDK